MGVKGLNLLSVLSTSRVGHYTGKLRKEWCIAFMKYASILYTFNPFTPMSDQDRISPYNINTISTRQVMRIKKTIILEIIN